MIATVDQIVSAAANLPPADRIQIIRCLAATLSDRTAAVTPEFLPYGKYREGPESTEEDFLIAEWRPDEADSDGE